METEANVGLKAFGRLAHPGVRMKASSHCAVLAKDSTSSVLKTFTASLIYMTVFLTAELTFRKPLAR